MYGIVAANNFVLERPFMDTAVQIRTTTFGKCYIKLLVSTFPHGIFLANLHAY